MEELKEQLQRCLNWLKEEPDDLEVQAKAEELRTQIDQLEKKAEEEATAEKRLEEQKNDLAALKALKKNIDYMSRELRRSSGCPIIPGHEDMCRALGAIDDEFKEVYREKLPKAVAEFNKLAIEYNQKYFD